VAGPAFPGGGLSTISINVCKDWQTRAVGIQF